MNAANQIRQYIDEELLVPDGMALQTDSPLWGGVLDSAGLMQLITYIEERFEIEIADEELTSTHFGTVAGIAALIDRKTASQ